MSKANPNVDLSSLARPSATPSSSPPRRRWLFVAVPVALLTGFFAVLATSLGDTLRGGLEVEIVRPVPVAGGGSGQKPVGEVVVQAAGWVEPEPFPIRVSALTSGFVREVLVRESDLVVAGAPIAKLVEADILLDFRQAEALLAESGADVSRSEAEMRAAKESFEAALAVRERVALAEADLEGKRATATSREHSVIKARSRLSAVESELEVQHFLAEAGAAGPRAVELAEVALAEAQAEIEITAAEAEQARAQARVGEAVLESARRDLELRIEERLRVATAEAEVALAKARQDQAQVAYEQAQLRLERTTVRAPVAGVVLQRLVAPGAELTGENAGVATLYDPRSLRVRVDVPQADIAKLFVGQQVRIEADARPGQPYVGDLIRIVRQADINKVTLQAHVRIVDGDELLRPEMLVQARFLAGGTSAGGDDSLGDSGSGVVLIPAELVLEGGKVWVLDALGKEAELRSVLLGAEVGREVEVREGLNLSDKLIATRLSELSPGMSVHATPARRER